jgi:hypothetical protein
MKGHYDGERRRFKKMIEKGDIHCATSQRFKSMNQRSRRDRFVLSVIFQPVLAYELISCSMKFVNVLKDASVVQNTLSSLSTSYLR